MKLRKNIFYDFYRHIVILNGIVFLNGIGQYFFISIVITEVIKISFFIGLLFINRH